MAEHAVAPALAVIETTSDDDNDASADDGVAEPTPAPEVEPVQDEVAATTDVNEETSDEDEGDDGQPHSLHAVHAAPPSPEPAKRKRFGWWNRGG